MLKGSSQAVALIVLLWVAGCGSSTALIMDGGGSGGSGGKVGSGGTTGGPDAKGTGGTAGSVPHRATATACPHSPFETDAGLASCTTDSECATDAGFPAQHCVQHACTIDACLSDADCPADSVCGCGNQFGGNGLRTNQCVPSTCHVDSDCTTGLCSPANNARCSSLTGYHCRGPADTCAVDADCAHPSGGMSGCVPGTACDAGINAGIAPAMSCQYAPEVAHWQCAPVMVCNG